MSEEIERQIKETKKALGELVKKRGVLRFQPCRGDRELLQKDQALEELDREIESLNNKARQLEKKLRDAKYGVTCKPE